MECQTPVETLQRAIDKAGGQSAFAVRLSELIAARGLEPISSARVWNWLNRDKRAPSEFCPDIEVMTGERCEELRPDVNWSAVRSRRRAPASTPHTN